MQIEKNYFHIIKYINYKIYHLRIYIEKKENSKKKQRNRLLNNNKNNKIYLKIK